MIKLYFLEIDSAKFRSDTFTRNILGENLNVASDSIAICKNKFGKPYLRDYPGIFYNTSHTKGALVCALSNKPVGVDIEKVKSFDCRIARRFFTQQEQEYIFSDKINQNEKFAEIWTMKEAYVKCVGKGMEEQFDSFNVLQKRGISSFPYRIYYIAICTNEGNHGVSLIDLG